MCNLYSITTNQDAIRRLFGVTADSAGNLSSMPGVFPDYEAPVVRAQNGQRELIKMRWGMPPLLRTGGPSVTNIRNTSLPHWRGWPQPESPLPGSRHQLCRVRPRSESRERQEGCRLVCTR
jgi:putative SOS response-associated peptidase YedK